MGVSERWLRKFLKELEASGYIRIKRQGLNKPNLYYILDVKTKLEKAKKRGGSEV
jgi:DNA-binding HxlR family transcriptional regulator